MTKKLIKRTTIYEGLFVMCQNFDDGHYDRQIHPFEDTGLENPISNPHVTVAYKPEKPHRKFYGEEAFVMVMAYGNDGDNEGYFVKIIPNDIYTGICDEADKDFSNLLENVKTPHITLSVSNDGIPKNTVNLDFKPVPFEKRMIIRCVFGAFEKHEYDDGTTATRYVTHCTREEYHKED
jgi:hypothetical protein